MVAAYVWKKYYCAIHGETTELIAVLVRVSMLMVDLGLFWLERMRSNEEGKRHPHNRI